MPTNAAGPPAIINFRDAGGHATRDGSRVRTGVLYRSVALSRVDDGSLAALADLGIRTIFDLRTAWERDRDPDRLPDGAELVALDVLADSTQPDPAELFALMQDPPRASKVMSDGWSEDFYLTTYREFIDLPSADRAFGELLRTLARPERRPALVHCTTGKDRTGWVVAALLLYLGVPLHAVMADYLRSDVEVRRAHQHILDDFVARGGMPEVLEPLMGVQPSLLEVTVERMRERYGSVEAYLGDGLGVDEATRARLRDAFLTPG